MNRKLPSVLSALLVAVAPLSALAGSLTCQDNIISPGVTIEQLLEACGEPASRNGADWIRNISETSTEALAGCQSLSVAAGAASANTAKPTGTKIDITTINKRRHVERRFSEHNNKFTAFQYQDTVAG